MKTLPVSPRTSTSLPHGETPATEPTVTPSTRSLADVVADLNLGDEHRLADFIERIEELDCEGGPDVMRSDIDAVLRDIQLEPEAGVSTLLLHLITKLDAFARSDNPHIPDIAVERLQSCLDLFEVCSDSFGAPTLDELWQARETDGLAVSQELQDCRDELYTWLEEMAKPIIETRLVALGLPSNHEGTEINSEVEELPTSFEDEDCNPWQMEVISMLKIMKFFDMPLDPLKATLDALVLRAETGLESRAETGAQRFDLACLNDFVRNWG